MESLAGVWATCAVFLNIEDTCSAGHLPCNIGFIQRLKEGIWEAGGLKNKLGLVDICC